MALGSNDRTGSTVKLNVNCIRNSKVPDDLLTYLTVNIVTSIVMTIFRYAGITITAGNRSNSLVFINDINGKLCQLQSITGIYNTTISTVNVKSNDRGRKFIDRKASCRLNSIEKIGCNLNIYNSILKSRIRQIECCTVCTGICDKFIVLRNIKSIVCIICSIIYEIRPVASCCTRKKSSNIRSRIFILVSNNRGCSVCKKITVKIEITIASGSRRTGIRKASKDSRSTIYNICRATCKTEIHNGCLTIIRNSGLMIYRDSETSDYKLSCSS